MAFYLNILLTLFLFSRFQKILFQGMENEAPEDFTPKCGDICVSKYKPHNFVRVKILEITGREALVCLCNKKFFSAFIILNSSLLVPIIFKKAHFLLLRLPIYWVFQWFMWSCVIKLFDVMRTNLFPSYSLLLLVKPPPTALSEVWDS